MTRRVYIDLETQCELDIEVGTYRYAERAQILCAGWAVDQSDPRVWRAFYQPDVPRELRELAEDPETIWVAHNANFDRIVLAAQALKVPLERWSCTQARARYQNIPAGLETAAQWFGIEGKDSAGSDLIKRLSKPAGWTDGDLFSPAGPLWHEDRESMERMFDYCWQDTKVLRDLDALLPELPEFEHNVWLEDQRINDRGWYFDRDAATKLSAHYKTLVARDEQRALELTQGRCKASQTAAYLKWMRELWPHWTPLRSGKTAIALQLERSGLPDPAREALELLKDSRSAVGTKFQRMLDWSSEDDRLRGLFVYGLAQNMRWAGKGPQPHNLPSNLEYDTKKRTKADIVEATNRFFEHGIPPDDQPFLAFMARPCLTAPEGYVLGISDFSSIEPRTAAWLSGAAQLLEAFRAGSDPYEALVEELGGAAQLGELARAFGKLAWMSFCYGTGGPAFCTTMFTVGGELREIVLDQKLALVSSWVPAIHGC